MSNILIPQRGLPPIRNIQIITGATFQDIDLPQEMNGNIVVQVDIFCTVAAFALTYVGEHGDVQPNSIPFAAVGANYSVMLRGVGKLRFTSATIGSVLGVVALYPMTIQPYTFNPYPLVDNEAIMSGRSGAGR